MKNRFSLKTLLLLLVMIVVTSASIAQENSDFRTKVRSTGVPAAPYPFDYQQPGGDLITIYIKGDGAIHWYQTEDDYTIMQDLKGVYYYATLNDKGDLVMTEVKVSRIENRTSEETSLLQKIGKEVRYSKEQIEKMKAGYLPRTDNETKGGSYPTQGTNNLILILQDFPDASFTQPLVNFDNMMNLTGYNGTGSFKDYYFANSYGQVTMVTTVLGWYTAANNHDYYCDGCVGADPNARYREFVREAVDFAEGAGVDFSQYDNNNDGECDGVMVIHQGEGAECGSNRDIWSHSWSLSAAAPTSLAVTYDGTYINDYTLNPELTCSGTMGSIGVLCHEFGHNFGLPDFYDTDYSTNGQGFDLGEWDPMASGSYNNNGASPPLHNAWSRDYLDWFTIQELMIPCSYTLDVSYDNQEAFYYTTNTPNEYFILENRQQSGFDAFLPGHGMLVFHVDRNYAPAGSNVWDVNMVNAYSTHQAMDLEEADGTTTTVAGDPFPGTANRTSFTDLTTPNSRSWAGVNTNKPITNIVESGGLITFDFMGGDSGTPQSFTAVTVSSEQLDLSWNLNLSGDPVLIAYSLDGVFGEPNPGMVYSVNDAITGGGTVINNSNGTSYSHTGLSPSTRYYYKAWSVGSGEVYTCGKPADEMTCFVPEISVDFEDLSNDWTTEASTVFKWWQIQGPTPTASTGPSVDHTIGTSLGTYMYTESSSGVAGNAAYLLSPLIDLSTIASPTLRFYYHMYGATMGTLSVEVYNGGAWTQIWTISGQQHISGATPWTEQILDLSGYKNDYEQIRFKGVRGSGTTSDMAVDDISIYNSFTCTPPTVQASGFSTGTITQSSMQINWTRGNGDNVLVLAREGSPVDADPFLGTTYTANTTYGSGSQVGSGNYVVFDGNGTTVTVTGLNPSTTYHFAVYEYDAVNHCYNVNELTGNENTFGLPTVSTSAVTGIAVNTAQCGGNVLFENGSLVNARGVVWSTSTNPTTGLNEGMTTDGTGIGVFVSTMTALAPNTTYYVRAYATNAYGTGYGVQYSFTTLCGTYSLPYSQNFDAGAGCFDGTTGTDDWYNIVPIIPAGDHTGAGGSCFMTNGNSNYNTMVVYDLVSPEISLSGYSNCQLSFWIYMNAELSGGGDYWDGGYLECWNGTAWTKMTTSLAYDGNLYVGSDNPLAGELAWSPAAIRDWTQVTVNLSAYDGNPDFKFRIRFGSDAAAVGPGWAVDDVTVTGNIACTQPGTQASNVNSTPNLTSIGLTWTRGTGNNVLVVAKEGSAIDSDPILGTNYTANAAFGTGDQIGSGNFVVYNGPATTVTVTGLDEATTYHFSLYEYNTTGYCYLYPGALYNATTTTTPPTIALVSPNSFYADRGKQVTITGAGFLAATVTLGGVTGSIVSNDGSTLIVDFPAGNYIDNVLTVSNSGGSDTETCTVNTRSIIPVGIGADFHTTVQSALDGLFAWYGSTSFDAGQLPGTKYIDVYNGTYAEMITPNVSLAPTSGSRLVIQNHAGASPVVNATGKTNGFHIGALNYVTVTGFTVYGANSDNIYTEGDYNLISYNKSYSSVGGSGIKLLTADNSTVDHNLVYGNFNYGISLEGSITVLSENNTAYDNGNLSAGMPGAQNVQLFFQGWESGSTGWTMGTWSVQAELPRTGTSAARLRNATSSMTSPSINVTGYQNVEIHFWYRTNGTFEGDEYLRASYSTNGGTSWIQFHEKLGSQSSYVEASVVVPGTPTNLLIRFDGFSNGLNPSPELWYVDDILIYGDEPNIPGGSAFYVESGTGTVVENNIFYAKTGDDAYYALQTENGITVTSQYNTYYSTNTNLFNYSGTIDNTGPINTGDITTDPQFVNAPSDFHLKSASGSYTGGEWPPLTSISGTWTNDASDSPAIDAGNPGDAYGNEPANNGGIINQGTYGNTIQASKSAGALLPVVWDGSLSTDWQTLANWTPEQIPTASDDVTIPVSCLNYPLVNNGIGTPALCNNLTISGGSVTIAPDGYMTVAGSITNSVGVTGLVIQSTDGGTGSLIQNSSSDVNATIQCRLSSTTNQWHMVSSPITTAAFTVFPSQNNLYLYNEGTADYWTGTVYNTGSLSGWTTPSGNLDVGRGYSYNFYATTLTYSGVLNNNTSTSAIAVPYTNHGVGAPNGADYDNFDGWNLIGNPYTSAIDWDDLSVLHGAANLLDAVYTYDDKTLHNYTSYVGGTGTNGGTRYIPAMQGFFVKGAATELGGTLNIGANARVHNAQSYWKGYNETPENFIRLEVSGNGYKDETVVRMLDGATEELDNGMDAFKFFTMHTQVPQIYTRTNGDADYSINTVATLNEGSMSVPIRMIQTGVSYTIRVSEFNFNGIKVYLKDNYNSKTTEIGLEDEIEMTAEESDATDRFELVFEKSSSSIVSDVNNIDVTIYPNPNEGTFTIRLEHYYSGYELEIANVIGQLVYKNVFEDAYAKEIKIDGAKAGIYFLKIRLEDGSVVNRKIIVNY
jgi:M6 family metalloprotease-like protein